MKKKCAGGFPRRSDRCANEPGPRNPYWCDDCDRLRIAHISAQMEGLRP